MTKETGGPAFPIDIESNTVCIGMTLRDYFAARYMQAVCSAILTESKFAQTSEEDMFRLLQSICATAYLTADLMVEEREVKND